LLGTRTGDSDVILSVAIAAADDYNRLIRVPTELTSKHEHILTNLTNIIKRTTVNK